MTSVKWVYDFDEGSREMLELFGRQERECRRDDSGSRRWPEIGTDYAVGTMIELPRACFVANRIAQHADFFSFGTNDLTQTALGFSRDDVESAFVPTYIDRKIIDRSPFETIDAPGVGGLSGWRPGSGAKPGQNSH
jgi:phosphoenolpyruvate synthase/pyruvate phosphate dikinase